jgi:AraC-like DNA-binding protein
MHTEIIDSFGDVGKSPVCKNYIVRSNLSVGQAQSCSSTVSAKMVLAGSETYAASGVRFPIRQGQFLLAVPGETYELTVGSSALGCCFYFDLTYVNRLLSEILSEDLDGGDGSVFNLHTLRLPQLGSTLGQLMFAMANKTIAPDFDTLTIALAEHACYLSRLDAKLPYQRNGTRRELVSRIELARSYLLEAGNNTVTLSELERASCLSRYHLVRAFTLVHGIPPLRFHQNQRLDAAREQITINEDIHSAKFNT